MEMAKIYADDYNISFVEQSVFLNFLSEREENASWQKKVVIQSVPVRLKQF